MTAGGCRHLGASAASALLLGLLLAVAAVPTHAAVTCGKRAKGKPCPDPKDCCSAEGYCGQDWTFCQKGRCDGAGGGTCWADDQKVCNPTGRCRVRAKDGEQALVVCREGKVITEIREVLYGRTTKGCVANKSKSVRAVSKLCLGKKPQRECSVPVDEQTFGRDPCPNEPGSNNLILSYTCGKSSSSGRPDPPAPRPKPSPKPLPPSGRPKPPTPKPSPPPSSEVCSGRCKIYERKGATVQLACQPGLVIAKLSKVIYGREKHDCVSSTAASVVSGMCLGQEQCSVDAQDSQFGEDPCPKVSGRNNLKITYTCSSQTRPQPQPEPQPKPEPIFSPSPLPRPSPSPQPSPGGKYVFVPMTEDQKLRMYQLTSIFENADTELQYSYAERLGDDRGITYGFCGFTTGTADGLMVVEEYTKLKPGNELERFLPGLRKVKMRGDVFTGLNGFEAAVKSVGEDPDFVKAQWTVCDTEYNSKAMKLCRDIKCKHTLTKAQLHDAMVNHGMGLDDKFSIDYILMAAKKAAGGTPATGVEETKWLAAFLKARDKLLTSWDKTSSVSTNRVKMYQELLEIGNLELDGPIYIDKVKRPAGTWQIKNVYYGTFLIK